MKRWVALSALLQLGVIICLWLCDAKIVMAQEPAEELDSQLFLPTVAKGTTFTLASPSVPRHLTYELGLASNFALKPLERGGDGQDVVAWSLQTELLFALGLFEWMELGLAAPLVVANASNDALAEQTSPETVVRAGDTRLTLKVPILRRDFSLSGNLVVALPSGDAGRFLGTGYWTTAPSAIMSYDFGAFILGAEVGYRFRRKALVGDLEYDDELFFVLGGSVELTEAISLLGESQLRLGVAGDRFAANENPMEVDAGVRFQMGQSFSFDAGAGTGVLRGYGAPVMRAFMTLRYASEREPCAAGPEDFDGFEDGDFCADPDNDADGTSDFADECPNDPEDKDGFADGDGCPDVDNDADGVFDSEDKCPLRSEDRDGFEDEDGCPDNDNDSDGVRDGLDQCPMEPEDADRFEDEDGCPEPGPERATITVTDTRILISERIYFDFDRDTIRSVSIPLLDRVAQVIRDLPASKRVRVEGYTDANGDPEYNRDLSYRRARSVVEYLVAHGARRKRLDYVGYGQEHPVAPSDTPEGSALNRRVEFSIFDRGVTRPRRPSRRKK